MNPRGPADSLLVDMLASTLRYLIAIVSAFLVVGVVVYIAMVERQLRARLHSGTRSARRTPRGLLARAVVG